LGEFEESPGISDLDGNVTMGKEVGSAWRSAAGDSVGRVDELGPSRELGLALGEFVETVVGGIV